MSVNPNQQIAQQSASPTFTIPHSAAGVPGEAIGVLVSKKDPLRRGRLQVRFPDQSPQLIPDEKLPWSEGIHKGTGRSGSHELGRYIVGERVKCLRNQKDMTYQIIAQVTQPDKSQGTDNFSTDADTKYLPAHTQGNKNERVSKAKTPTQTDFTQRPEVEAPDNMHDTSRDKGVKRAPVAGDALSIGSIFDNLAGKNVLNTIKKIDPSNTSGAVQPAVDIMKKLLNNTDPLKALQGMMGNQLYGVLGSTIAKFNSAKAGSAAKALQIGDPCAINGLVGSMQYNSTSELVCTIDPATPIGTPCDTDSGVPGTVQRVTVGAGTQIAITINVLTCKPVEGV